MSATSYFHYEKNISMLYHTMYYVLIMFKNVEKNKSIEISLNVFFYLYTNDACLTMHAWHEPIDIILPSQLTSFLTRSSIQGL